MNTITHTFINIYRLTNHWYRQDSVQIIVGSVQCVFGIMGTINLVKDYQLVRKDIRKQSWKIQAVKIIETLGNLSCIGGALTSYPMLKLWCWSTKYLFSSNQIQRFFGHRLYCIITIASILIGLPSTLKTTYDAYFLMIRKTIPLSPTPARQIHEHRTQLIVTVNAVIEGTKLASEKLLVVTQRK